MKRMIIAALATVMLFALMPIGSAAATGGTTAKNQISIQRDAQYDVDGFIIHVGLVVTCEKSPLALPGSVEVSVTQDPPETPYPLTAGSGLNNVVCDGKPHAVGVTVQGEGFDAGKAHATATLFPAVDTSSAAKTVTTQRDIYIFVMK